MDQPWASDQIGRPNPGAPHQTTVSNLTSVENYTTVLNIDAKLNVGSNGLPVQQEPLVQIDNSFIPNANSPWLSTTAPFDINYVCSTQQLGCAPAIYSLDDAFDNAAAITSPTTGMKLTITTDAPAIQFSTYQGTAPPIYGKGGWITTVSNVVPKLKSSKLFDHFVFLMQI